MIDVISLTRELVQIESTDPGTYEEALGEFFDQWFSRIGILSAASEVLPGRRNRMVELPGESSGPAMICTSISSATAVRHSSARSAVRQIFRAGGSFRFNGTSH